MIYHYCSQTAFESIIATKQVWLTDITKLNDCTEYKSGFDLILDVLKNKGLEERQVFQDIRGDKLNDSFQILVGCFSQEGDSGSQWRLYADETKGLSVGFDEKEIAQFNMFNRFIENKYQAISSHVKFYEVQYDQVKFLASVTALIERLEQNNPLLKDQLMAVALRRLAATYKDPFFKDEREMRAMVEIEPGRDDKYVVGERTNAYNELANYHKLLTSFQGFSAIKDIIIGPNCPYSLEDVKELLRKQGLDHVTLRHSSGRGRYRTASQPQ
jgi:hypothetical protein